MKITINPHTVLLLVGPTRCGKTTFSYLVVNEVYDRGNVICLSSDGYRRRLLQGDGEYMNDSHDRAMLEVSKQAFALLMSDLRTFTEFPVDTDIVIVDTRGFDKAFRDEVVRIATGNGFAVDCVVFDYKNASDYISHTDEHHSQVVAEDVRKFRRKVLPDLSRRDFGQLIRVRDPNFEETLEIELGEGFGIKDWCKHTLDHDATFAVIGDTHECVDQLDELINRLPNSVEKIVHVGDYLDKGQNTEAMVRYMFKRVTEAGDILVRGNHESYLYRRLKGEIPLSASSAEVEATYFTALPVLEANATIRDLFFALYEASLPFLKLVGAPAEESGVSKFRTTFVTHAPCDTKHLGKVSDNAQRAQRNLFVKNRSKDADEREDMKFIYSQASFIEPLHIFGHMAHQGRPDYRNKIFLDTGCVHGGQLTAVVIKNGEYGFIQVHGVNTMPRELSKTLSQPKKEVKPFSIHDYDLSPDDLKFLRRTMSNGVKFISGTMAPAPSQNGLLEPLAAALDYYRKHGVDQVVLQPKYMGSRCQFYLNFEEPEKSFAVSRNGYVIKHVEGLDELLLRWSSKGTGDLFPEYFIGNKSAILDGELLPWGALGSGLIEKGFKTYGALIQSELAVLHHDPVFQEFQIGKNHETESRLKDIGVFAETLNLYSGNTELEYRAFNILMVDDEPYQFNSGIAFKTVNDAEQIMIDISSPLARDPMGGPIDLLKAEEFFQKLTMVQGMEGVVVKPVNANDVLVQPYPIQIPEYLKVRNEQYLTLVYGYDYKRRYDFMVQKKNISSKVRVSVAESNIGKRMLVATPEERPEFIVKMISELKREQSLDPRL